MIGVKMSGGSSSEMVSAASPRRINTNEKRITFDIENDSNEELKYANKDFVDSAKNPVVVADILKTLFFILVWYTFSTFLTL